MNLLEVVIAFYIMTIFSLAYTKLEKHFIHAMQNNYLHNLATTQIFALAERFSHNIDLKFRQREFELWQKENADLLPGGRGFISKQKNSLKIKMTWREYFSHKILSCETS